MHFYIRDDMQKNIFLIQKYFFRCRLFQASIRAKMVALGLVVMIALVSLLVTSLITNRLVKVAVDKKSALHEQNQALIQNLSLLNALRLSQAKLANQGLFVILSREHGIISREEIEKIDVQVAGLTSIFNELKRKTISCEDYPVSQSLYSGNSSDRTSQGEKSRNMHPSALSANGILPPEEGFDALNQSGLSDIGEKLKSLVVLVQREMQALIEEHLTFSSTFAGDLKKEIESIETHTSRIDHMLTSLRATFSAQQAFNILDQMDFRNRMISSRNRMLHSAIQTRLNPKYAYLTDDRMEIIRQDILLLFKGVADLQKIALQKDILARLGEVEKEIESLKTTIEKGLFPLIEKTSYKVMHLQAQFVRLQMHLQNRSDELDKTLVSAIETDEKVLVEADKDLTSAQVLLKTRVKRASMISNWISICAIFIVIFFFALFSRSMVTPLLKAANMARAIRKKDYSKRLNLARFDEIGILANALDSMADKLMEESRIRQEVENQLSESKEFLQNIFDSSADGIMTTDIHGNVIFCSPMVKEIFAYDPREIVGEKVYRFYQNGKEDAKRIMRELGRYGDLRNHDLKIIQKNKNIAHINLSASFLKNGEGETIGTLGIFRDVTVQTRLEDQLRQSQKMEAIGTLAGGIAHDFNNILAAIIGYTELALSEPPSGTKAKKHMENVLHAANRASNLVKQILTFSRMTEKEMRPLKVVHIVKEVLKLMRASLPTTIDIRQSINSRFGMAKADPTGIHQVLMNLCTNAAHAMQDSGGILEVSLMDMDIDQETASFFPELSPGPYLKLVVSDTGHGMDRGTLDRIFEPFFTTKGPGKGTGMGLAVTHGIIKSHGGAVTVFSVPGKGTKFQVLIPRIEEELTQTPHPVQPSLPTGRECILFVDDEEALVDFGKQILKRLGYNVVGVTNAVDALRFFSEEPYQFDLVITDQTMPKMTGLELAGALLKIRPDLPVILCSGYSESITNERIQSIGIRQYMTKPYLKQELAQTIRDILDEAQKTR